MGKVYRQNSHKLRIHHPGRPDRMSVRPRGGSRERGWGRFLDEDNPTLVSFEEGDQVDVASMLRIGAIAEIPQPAEEVESGEKGRE